MALNEIRFDLFDLRKPSGFIHYSMQGFFLYGIVYIALTKTQKLATNQCVDAFPSLAKLFDACGIDAWVIAYQAIFFASALIFVTIFKKSEWSFDAIFNSLSVLIISISATTVFVSLVWGGSALIILDYYIFYCLLAVMVALVIFRTMTVGRRSRLSAKSIFILGHDEIRLMAIYYILASLYLIFALRFLDGK